MKSFQRVMLLVLIVIVTIGLSGCMKKLGPEEIKEEMLALLEQKYGEEFVAVTLTRANWAYSYDKLKAYPKNGGREDAFAVWGTRQKDGTYSIQDGYFGVIIKDKYEAALKSLVGEVYKDFKLYVLFGNESVYPNRLNKDSEINDIYREDEFFSTQSRLFVKQSEVQKIGYHESKIMIAEKMLEQKIVSSVLIYEVYDEKFEEVSLDTMKQEPSTFGEFFVDYRRMPIGVTPELKISGKEYE